MRISRALLGAGMAVVVLGAAGAAPAHAAPKAKSYANCTALQKDYSHGVGKKGAKDKTSGKPVTNFKVSSLVYSFNDGKDRRQGERDLDRDNDGIACEKR